MATAGLRGPIDAATFDAAVFDLDGVVTRTARVHAAAWKAMFDEYLSGLDRGESATEPFDVDRDYRRHVDGKPRYEGVRDFLASRGIELPFGDPSDDPGKETVCGLGNRKNAIFLDKLATDGVEPYASSVTLIRRLRASGKSTAVVSSSRNCRAVLEAAGLGDLFDARVDGRDLEHARLAGKPAPDMFLEAARRLDCEPGRSLGVEDAVPGVTALRCAGYAWVIGVDREQRPERLRDAGAQRVVGDLEELDVIGLVDPSRDALPSALEHLDELLPGDGGEPVVFLDFDGTLTPIVSRPEDAVLSESMREVLSQLRSRCEVAVISGRDLADVRERVGIAGLWYAGSHGFDIAGPEDERHQYREGIAYLPELDAAESQLADDLAGAEGVEVERKRFAIAVHYRNAEEGTVPRVRRAVENARRAHPGLRLSEGKKLFELQPDIEWDKGKALSWMLQALDMDPERFRPLYIGDDVTDEDAFHEIAEDGAGILVGRGPRHTAARYRLADPAAVERFLRELGARLQDERP